MVHNPKPDTSDVCRFQRGSNSPRSWVKRNCYSMLRRWDMTGPLRANSVAEDNHRWKKKQLKLSRGKRGREKSGQRERKRKVGAVC